MATTELGASNADRSNLEIKTLLRKLDPKAGNHKDRIRRLNKFRNYVIGDNKHGTPEFYDDDIPLLFMGSAAPAIYLESIQDEPTNLYGLLQACGTPSGEHDGTLKRSAKHAMQLLKWLLLEWREKGQDSVNLFAQSFLQLTPKQYRSMALDLHLSPVSSDRGGAKEDACQIIVLILTKHLNEEGTAEKPLLLEDLLARPQAQQEFELWLARNAVASVQEAIQKNAAARQAELAEATTRGNFGGTGHDDDWASDAGSDDHSDGGSSDSEHDGKAGGGDHQQHDDGDDDDLDDIDDGDVMAAMRKRKKSRQKQLKEAEGRGEITAKHGVATRWEDSQLAREQRARAASAARAGQHDTVRDSQEAAQEAFDREEEKLKVLGKDPLGIIQEIEFDLSLIETAQAEQMEQALQEAQEELQKAEATGNEKAIKKAAAKKECLESFTYRLGGIEAMENTANLQHSVLCTNPNFNPLLFLTLVHRNSAYDTLINSFSRLSNKTENQVEQLQNLVRDNFPLFVRCAEGFEQFRKSSETEVGLGVNERIDKLEAIAESSAFQAKKSFKPLLDNTSEVRKVQSAMAVLQRVAPILQVPALMRQHIENRRYSQALKTYRRVLVVDKSCKIELLNHVKLLAEQCVREARRALESRLAHPSASTDDLLAAIRDLGEELSDLPLLPETKEKCNSPEKTDEDLVSQGIYSIGGHAVNLRDHPPALACLLVQAAHFSVLVNDIVDDTEEICRRIFSGESFADVQKDLNPNKAEESPGSTRSTVKGAGNQWKYDVLDARVQSTVRAVDSARVWLPRLIRIGRAAREDEKRRAARIGGRRGNISMQGASSWEDNQLTAFEVFISNIAPSMTRLVEHAAFCAIGSGIRSSGKEVTMTFGHNMSEKLRALLRSPLPPSQSGKVGQEIANLVELLSDSSAGASALRPLESSAFQLSPLDECKGLGEAALITIEKRRCMYAFDVCSRGCSNKATGNGKLDADALISCLKKLTEQLSRPGECSTEVEKGCELVIRRCCEGLASYVRDRGDSARLGAVAECADVMANRVDEIVQEAALLTPNGHAVHEVIMEDIMGLESALFDEYLEHISKDVASSVRVGWLDTDMESADGDASLHPSFPAYLSASLLAIVRCRAQVEQSLGDKARHAEGSVPYQHLTMTTVADGVVEGICNEILIRKQVLKVRQADRLANELEFLKNSLKRFLGEAAKAILDSTLQMVAQRAGRGRDYQGDGPDGLAALEELERLGRVYVLCLGE